MLFLQKMSSKKPCILINNSSCIKETRVYSRHVLQCEDNYNISSFVLAVKKLEYILEFILDNYSENVKLEYILEFILDNYSKNVKLR